MSILGCEPDVTDDLQRFVLDSAPMPPPETAGFGAVLAEHLAWHHADGRRVGPFDTGVRVNDVDGHAVPVIVATAPPEAWDGGVGDIQAVGELLVALLGVSTLPARGDDLPVDGPPDTLWSVVLGCLDIDPGWRPAAAVLARQLREVRHDLLDDAPFPSADPDDDRRRSWWPSSSRWPSPSPQWEGWWR